MNRKSYEDNTILCWDAWFLDSKDLSLRGANGKPRIGGGDVEEVSYSFETNARSTSLISFEHLKIYDIASFT